MPTALIQSAAATLSFPLSPVIALAAGIAILVWPKFLNYIVAGYLIITGAMGILGV